MYFLDRVISYGVLLKWSKGGCVVHVKVCILALFFHCMDVHLMAALSFLVDPVADFCDDLSWFDFNLDLLEALTLIVPTRGAC